MYLDLSKNRITELDFEELPEEIVFLKLSDNPYAEQEDYRSIVIVNLPELEELDSLAVTIQERFEAEGVEIDSTTSQSLSKASVTEVKEEEVNLLKNTAFMTDIEETQYSEMHNKLEKMLFKSKERLDTLYEARNKLQESISQ